MTRRASLLDLPSQNPEADPKTAPEPEAEADKKAAAAASADKANTTAKKVKPLQLTEQTLESLLKHLDALPVTLEMRLIQYLESGALKILGEKGLDDEILAREIVDHLNLPGDEDSALNLIKRVHSMIRVKNGTRSGPKKKRGEQAPSESKADATKK